MFIIISINCAVFCYFSKSLLPLTGSGEVSHAETPHVQRKVQDLTYTYKGYHSVLQHTGSANRSSSFIPIMAPDLNCIGCNFSPNFEYIHNLQEMEGQSGKKWMWEKSKEPVLVKDHEYLSVYLALLSFMHLFVGKLITNSLDRSTCSLQRNTL